MKKKNIAVIVFCMLIISIGFIRSKPITAATPSVNVVEIDYDTETMKIKATGNQQVFMAKTLTAKWEELSQKLDSDGCFTMDISWASKTSNVTFYLRGDVTTTPVKITLPKQSTVLRASYNLANNTIMFSNYGTATVIYWRKSVSTTWHEYKLNDPKAEQELKNELERFSLQGITLYFKTGQIKGDVKGVGTRPSKEVKVTIAKRAAAPSVKADYSKLTIATKDTMEYKKSTDNTWTKAKGTSLALSEVAPELLYNSNSNVEEVSIDFRTKATSTKAASQTATLVIPVQEDTDGDNINPQYIGLTQLKLNINALVKADGEVLKAASSSNPYEYTIVKPNETFNVTTATWTTITSTSTIIASTKAPVGSKIYVRKKATATALATAPFFFEVSEYPSASSLEKDIQFEKICGVEKSFTFAVRVPNDYNQISSITFAGKEAKFTASEATKSEDNNGYIITVKITDTTAIEAVTSNLDEYLDGTIILDNGDKIEKGITLFIYPPATVTGSNLVLFKDVSTEKDLELTLSLGHKSKELEEVESVTINDSKVEFSSKVVVGSTDKKTITIAKEELDQYANKLDSSKHNIAIPVVVKLKNGEEIKSSVTVTTKLIATISGTNSGMGISVSAYLENKAAIEKAESSEKSTTTINPIFENPELVITIDSTLFAKDSSYMISSVTWKDKSILRSFTISGNVIKVILDVNKIANLEIRDSDMVKVIIKNKNKEITIDSAYKITVVD